MTDSDAKAPAGSWYARAINWTHWYTASRLRPADGALTGRENVALFARLFDVDTSPSSWIRALR